MKIIIGCRHGESYKNLRDVFGGRGSALTDVGISQVQELAEQILEIQREYQLPISLFISCDRIHIIESAEILKCILNLNTVERDHLFCPIRLGVFDGMSRQKQQQLYPIACMAHQKWVKGLIDITESECLVEGMQTASSYVSQTKQFLKKLDEERIYVLLGTRSDMSCLQNILNKQRPEDYMQYKYYNFGYAQMTIAKIENNNKITKIDSVKFTTNTIDLER